MKKVLSFFAAAMLVSTALPLLGDTVIVSDSFTATNVISGFLLGEGWNSGINPPEFTRLTGTASANLRYVRRGNKNATAYTIASNRGNITQGTQSGRVTLGENDTDPYDFGSALGSSNATPANPAVYDITIMMDNNVSITDTNVGRMSFAFGTIEGGGGNWSFGVQIIPTTNGFYNVYKRIKTAASGLTNELNLVFTNTGANSSQMNFFMRVTDAGPEPDTNSVAHSRLQLSLDSGTNWIYDTQFDPSLTNGWRLESAARFVSFDQAPNGGADVYDNFSITRHEPVGSGVLTIRNDGGNANINLAGTPDKVYIIQRSQDLTAWTDITTNTAAADGSIQYSETPPYNPAFYRTRTE